MVNNCQSVKWKFEKVGNILPICSYGYVKQLQAWYTLREVESKERMTYPFNKSHRLLGGGSAPASFQTLTNCIASQIINIAGSIISLSRLALDNCWNYIVYIRRMDTSMTSKVNDICPYITMQKLLQMIAKTRSNVYKISKHCWYFRRKNDIIKFWCHIA